MDNPGIKTLRDWLAAARNVGLRPSGMALNISIWKIIEEAAGVPGIMQNEGYSINMNGEHYIDGTRIFWVEDLGKLGGVLLYDMPNTVQAMAPMMEEDEEPELG